MEICQGMPGRDLNHQVFYIFESYICTMKHVDMYIHMHSTLQQCKVPYIHSQGDGTTTPFKQSAQSTSRYFKILSICSIPASFLCGTSLSFTDVFLKTNVPHAGVSDRESYFALTSPSGFCFERMRNGYS